LRTISSRVRPSGLLTGTQRAVGRSADAVHSVSGTTCVVIEGSGHVPYVEQPAQLFTPLRAFLRDTGSLPSAVT